MSHPLVDQFRFTRSEWLRGLDGISEEDGSRHFGSMNCISWTVGHLAWHEQRTFLQRPQDKIIFPELNELFAYGAPMNTPSFKEMMEIWHTITEAADPYLDSLTTETLQTDLLFEWQTGRTIAWLCLKAHHLSLLVSYWRNPGDASVAWSYKPA